MPKQTHVRGEPMKTLRRIALGYPEAEEGVACKGTAIECTTFKARNKAFLFVGAADVRVKLGASLAAAAKLEAKEPSRYKVGAHGWVLVKFSADAPLRLDLFPTWIDESYRSLAPKQLVAQLPAGGLPTGNATATVKKQAPKKKPVKTKA
jgi:hypothetical protein